MKQVFQRTWITDSEDQTRQLGHKLGKQAKGGELFALIGPLGAGKTILAGGIMEGAGAKGPFRSPTFTLVWEYKGRVPIYHVDLYRLEGLDVEFDLHWDEIMGENSLAIVEWANKMPSSLKPRDRLEINITRESRENRMISASAYGECVHLLDNCRGSEA